MNNHSNENPPAESTMPHIIIGQLGSAKGLESAPPIVRPKVGSIHEYGGMKFMVSSVDEHGNVRGYDVTHGFNSDDPQIGLSPEDFKVFVPIAPPVRPTQNE